MFSLVRLWNRKSRVAGSNVKWQALWAGGSEKLEKKWSCCAASCCVGNVVAQEWVYKYIIFLQQSCCVSAFAYNLLPAISLEGHRKGQQGWGRKKELFSLSGSLELFPSPWCWLFSKVASPLWETELGVQLGRFLEVILKCMAALRPGTVCWSCLDIMSCNQR